MFEQLSLAYDFGIQQMWILNVGDLKPMEYPIQLFMDMAWDPKTHTQQNVIDHTRQFFAEQLGEQWANEAAAIYNQNCQYMARVTPEMLESLYSGCTDNSMAYQYLMAYYMLTGDRERYNNFISKNR